MPCIPSIQRERLYGVSLERSLARISDMAGRRDSSDRDLLDTCIREFQEESFGIFGHLTRDMLEKCPVLLGDDTALILYEVTNPLRPSEYTKKARKLAFGNSYAETQNILFFTVDQLRYMADNQNLRISGVRPFQMTYPLKSIIKSCFPKPV